MPASGVSNNPSGRPRGTGVVARLRREMLEEGKVGLLVDSVYVAAIAGDMGAARLLLDRIIPALRNQAAPVHLVLPAGSSLTEKASAVLDAMAAAELAPDVASEIIAAIGKLVSVEQADELRRRLDALEFGGIA